MELFPYNETRESRLGKAKGRHRQVFTWQPPKAKPREEKHYYVDPQWPTRTFSITPLKRQPGEKIQALPEDTWILTDDALESWSSLGRQQWKGQEYSDSCYIEDAREITPRGIVSAKELLQEKEASDYGCHSETPSSYPHLEEVLWLLDARNRQDAWGRFDATARVVHNLNDIRLGYCTDESPQFEPSWYASTWQGREEMGALLNMIVEEKLHLSSKVLKKGKDGKPYLEAIGLVFSQEFVGMGLKDKAGRGKLVIRQIEGQAYDPAPFYDENDKSNLQDLSSYTLEELADRALALQEEEESDE